MEALILNGSLLGENPAIKPLEEEILDLLEQVPFTINHILLKEKKIAPCQGCFDCWVDTPGICKIDDFGRIILEKIMESELVIYLTPIIFGGYSSELKKAIDRTIPLVLPFFRTYEGETHHKQRYLKRYSLITVGYKVIRNKKAEETFRKLVYRNTLNMEASIQKTLIYMTDQPISEFKKDFEEALEEVISYND